MITVPNNPDFKVFEFEHFRKEAGLLTFTPSVSGWIERKRLIFFIVNKIIGKKHQKHYYNPKKRIKTGKNHEFFQFFNILYTKTGKYCYFFHFLLLFSLIAIVFVVCIFHNYSHPIYPCLPLTQIKANLAKIENYDFEEVLAIPVEDEINEKLHHFVSRLQNNIQNISRDFTELEQALQVERERLKYYNCFSCLHSRLEITTPSNNVRK